MDPVCFEPGAGPNDPRAGRRGRAAGLMGQGGGIPTGALWPVLALPIIALLGYLASNW